MSHFIDMYFPDMCEALPLTLNTFIKLNKVAIRLATYQLVAALSELARLCEDSELTLRLL